MITKLETLNCGENQKEPTMIMSQRGVLITLPSNFFIINNCDFRSNVLFMKHHLFSKCYKTNCRVNK